MPSLVIAASSWVLTQVRDPTRFALYLRVLSAGALRRGAAHAAGRSLRQQVGGLGGVLYVVLDPTAVPVFTSGWTSHPGTLRSEQVSGSVRPQAGLGAAAEGPL